MAAKSPPIIIPMVVHASHSHCLYQAVDVVCPSTMNIYFPHLSDADEPRVVLTPETAGRLAKLGANVIATPGIGSSIQLPDEAFSRAAIRWEEASGQSWSTADIVCTLDMPPADLLSRMKRGTILIAHLDPFQKPHHLEQCAQHGISALSLEMIPRTTLAQKMDVLSSQASLAGYVAVLLAATRLPKIVPMMMTPAGTLSPSRVFVIGAGVAGLQAIATARRLGARVEAFDTRPAVEEQIASLGARFIKVDLGETGQTEGGYARALTEAQLALQRAEMAKAIARADIVITTAQVFGRPAPIIITDEMIAAMQPGSVIVDLAVDTGGNVQGVVIGAETVRHGVTIIGHRQMARHVPLHASQMLANNVANLIEHFWNREARLLELRRDDEIMAGTLVTHEGRIVHPRFAPKENA